MFTRNKIIVYVVVCLTLVGLGAYVASTVKSDDPVRDEAATMKTYSTVHDKKEQRTIPLRYTEPTSYATTEQFIYMTVDDANSDSISNQVIQINRKTGETQTIFKSHYEVAATQGLQTSKQWIV